jgi:outer membrane lipoprotein-sorting protein
MNRATKLGIFALTLAGLMHAADSADAAFARIDAAAKSFKGMTADLTDTEHNALVNEDEVNKGVVKFLRIKANSMRAVITWNNGSGGLEYNGKEGKLYNAKTKTVDVVNLSGKQSTVNKYLALGVGASSAELKSEFDVSYMGEENVGGQPTSHLKLVPKTHDPASSLKQADLWYGANGLVVQQKISHPSGDYQVMLYSNVKLGSIPEKELELQLPKGVTVQKH